MVFAYSVIRLSSGGLTSRGFLFKAESGAFSDVSTCQIHTIAPAGGAVSYEGYTDSTFLDRRYEDEMLQCQSTQCWSEYCPTCHGPSSMDLQYSPPGRRILSRPQNCGDCGIPQNLAERSTSADPNLAKCRLPTAEEISEEMDKKTEESIRNGGVVALVLGLGLGSALFCSMGSLVRLLPLLVIPAIYYYRKCSFAEISWRRCDVAAPQHSDEHAEREDQSLRERMSALESRNEQLLRELEKQRKTTDRLLRQLDEITPRSSATEARIERNDSEMFME